MSSSNKVEGLTSARPHVRNVDQGGEREPPALAEVFGCSFDIRRADKRCELTPGDTAAQQDMCERFQPVMRACRIWSEEASAVAAEK
jgi:hypothetical protein